MTGGRNGHEHDEDLVILARRQLLTDAERRELAAALAVDPTLRIAHEVGRAFDDVAFVQPGDEALIARVVDRAHPIAGRPLAARRWRTAGAVAATFLLVAGGAGAYRAAIVSPGRRTPALDVAPTERPHRVKAGARSPVEAPTPVPLAETAPPVAPSDPKGRALAWVEPRPPRAASTTRPSRTTQTARASAGPDERSPTPAARASDGATTAADLFRRAGAARRTGALATASALYEELQARFPAAEEARLSQVSLGKLLLGTGRPAEAEHHFALYLAGGAGALAAEAAFGRGESFERMGLAREERQAWLDLLRDFPESIYAGAARRRIAALDVPALGPTNPAKDVPAGDPANLR